MTPERNMQEVTEVVDPQRHQAHAKLPSEIAPASATRSQTPPQQAATSPESGSEVQTNRVQVPFKEQVIGVAKKTRGTVLRKPSLKEEGEKIIQGQLTFDQTKGTT